MRDPLIKRRSALKTKYGITLEQFDNMLIEQGFRCAICGKHQKDYPRNFSVDHNHKTLFVRGLLCAYCNGLVLKYLGDNKKRAEGIVKYLTRALGKDPGWQ